MKNVRRSSRRQPSSSRWHIPPPLIHGPETLEGGGILNEWRNELGVLLWQAARDVSLWATSAPADRGRTFVSGDSTPAFASLEDVMVAEDTRVRVGLQRLRQHFAAPATARGIHIAKACRQISTWADEQGRTSTALAFAQGAALADPSDAEAAFWAATVAVRMNDHARAEAWFRRAVGLARAGRDWRMYSRAFGGMGNLYLRRGNLPAARRLHIRALRGGRRGGMRSEQAAAYHDLFAVAIEAADHGEAERLARHALEAYGTRNGRVHVLAHDVAYHWMEQGFHGRALNVFQAVLPLIDRPLERLFVLADLARAAAGAGEAELAYATADEVSRLASRGDLEIGAARAFLETAHSYLALGLVTKAEDAARRALESAVRHRENKVRFAVEDLLERIASPPLPTRQSSNLPADAAPGDELAAEFVRTLQAIAGATP